MSEEKSILHSVSDQLGKVFRHLLSGILVMFLAYLSNPSWFSKVKYEDNNHFILLGLIAIVVGNVWYVLHRYIIEQFIDLMRFKIVQGFRENYSEWLQEHVFDTHHLENEHKSFRDHIFFRSSQIVFIFIIAEATIVLNLLSETDSILQNGWFLFGGIALLFMMIVQDILTHKLDLYSVSRTKK